MPYARDDLRFQFLITVIIFVSGAINPTAAALAETASGPEGGLVHEVALDPQDPDILYAATGSGGVFKSLDSGATWNPAKSGLYDLGVYDLVASADPPHLLAATGWGVYVSDNGGAEWSRYGNIPGGWEVWAVVRDPVDSSRVYAGSFGGGVFVTTDDGTTWIPHNTGLVGSGIVQLVVDPLTSALFAVTSSGGVFKTTDGASNWVQVGDGSVRDVVYLAIDPIDSSTLYAGTQCRGVFKSTDSGASWSLVNTGLGTPCGLSLLIDPDVPATIYAATRENGLFKSADGGASWYPSNSGLTTARLRELTIDASGDLYLATWGAGVFVSADEGDSWTATNDGLVATVVWTMARTSTTPETIFAGTLGARIFSTDNGGATWMSRSTGLPEAEIWALEAEPGDPMILYAGLNGAGVYQSTDGGLTWSSTGLGGQIWGFAISPASPSVVYVASQTGGAYRSDDRGDSWIHLTPAGPDNATEIAVDPTDASIVYLGTPFEGVFKSTDSGATWFSINEGLTDLDVRSLLIDPADPSVVYAGTMWTGVFKSTDGGLNWTRPDPDFWGTIVHLALDPATGDVYAAERFEPYSVHRSTDGGTTWEPVEGISHHAGTAVEVEVGPPARIYLGTDGGGVFVLESTGSEPCAPILGVNTLPSEDPQTWVNGLEVQLNGAVVPRPGCPPIAEVIWDWGDGCVSTSWFPASHRYPAPGEYLLTVTAYDTEGASATAQQTLNLLNVAPMAFDQSLSVAEDGSVEITLSATDPDGPVELLTYSIAGEPAHGTVSVDPCCPGWLVTYSPDPDYFGPDSFTFVAIDPFGSSSVATVSIEVIPTLHLTGLSPQPNALGIDPATRVSADFDAEVDPSTVNESTVKVWGLQSGFYEGALSLAGEEVEFAADAAFKPGETVMTTLTSGLSGTTAAPLDPPFTWQFTTAVDPSAGRFMDSGQELGGSSSWAVALGDVDGDGDLDAWVGSYNGQPNRLWINNGAGSYSDSGQALGNSSTLAVALGDVDDDGDLDAWAANVSGRPDRLWLNDGAGGFADSGQALGNTDSRAVALGDLDGDGDLDAWVGNWSGQPDRVWLNDGGGGFTDSGQLLGTSYSLGIALGDVDGDGDLDSWVANFSSQSDKVWLNSGTGIFTDSGQALGNSLSRAVVLGDMDDDGDLDAWVGNWSDQPNRMWLNDGGGGFSDSGQLLGNSTSWAVALGDVDGDGDLDVWVANRLQPLRLWLNDGAGGFTDSGQDLGDSTTQALALGDVDGDGDLDAWVGQDNLPDRVWINNLAPAAEGDVFTTPENTLLTASVLGNDVDLDGDPLTVSLVTGVTRGSLSLSPDGSFSYTPNSGFLGTDYFVYEVFDGPWTSSTAVVAIGVGTNVAPMAFDQSLSVAEGGSVEITLSATDPDGPVELLTYSIAGEPAHGTVSVDPCCPGWLVTYAPDPDFFGPDSFTFVAIDPFGSSSVATVSIEVIPTLHLTGLSPQPNALGIDPATRVSADFDAEVDPSTVNESTVKVWGLQSGFYEGALSLAGEEVEFAADAAFKPGETVMTTLTSGLSGTTAAPLDPPFTWQFTTAVDPSAGRFMDSGQELGAENNHSVALGDLDGDGDLDAWVGEYYSFLSSVRFSRVWLNDGAGTFLDSGQQLLGGVRSVALGDVDGDGDLDAWTATISGPNGVWLNDGAGGFADSGQTSLGRAKRTVALGDVDGDGDLDAWAGTSNGGSAEVWLNDDGGIFTDSGQTLGSYDSHAVALGDVDGDGDLDAWEANYNQPNRVWLNNGEGEFTEGQAIGGGANFAVALGDVDGDGDLDALVVRAGAQSNMLFLNDGAGSFSFSTDQYVGGASNSTAVALGDIDGDGDLDAWVGNHGQADQVYLNDGVGGFSDSGLSLGISDDGAVALGDVDGDGDLDAWIATLTRQPDRVWINNLAPVAEGDVFTTPENTPLTASVLGNDVDLDGDPLTVSLVTGVTRGSLSLSPDGSFSYTPNSGFLGTDYFVYEVFDGPWTSSTAVVAIGVGTNVPPVAFDQSLSVAEDGSVEITLSAADPDGPAELLTFSVVGEPAHGAVSVDPCCPGWLVTYSPDPDYFGPDSFTFVAIDPFGSSSVATVSIEVIPTLHLTGLSPQPNALGIDPATRVSADFDAEVDPSTVSESTLTVWGQQTGFYEGALSVVGGEVEFESDLTFKPGETVMTTLTAGLIGTTAAPLDPPFTWQFTTAVDPSAGNFMDSGQELGPQSVPNYSSAALGDLDGDGDLDAWIGTNFSPTQERFSRVWLNGGLGTFVDSGQDLGGHVRAVALGDVDDDGDLDAWLATSGPNLVWLNDGAGGFADSGQILEAASGNAVALGDLDGDGDLDSWVGSSYGPAQVWLNDGAGTFAHSGQTLGSAESLSVALGDVDGDGDLDAWEAKYNQPNRVWLNNGEGEFTEGQAVGGGYNFSAALGDVDGDGDLDALVVRAGTQANMLFLNDGSGNFTFSTDQYLEGAFNSTAVALGDLDGDGDLDAWVGNDGQPDQVYLNDGTGGFTDSGLSLGSSSDESVALGDLDGDGDLDAWLANRLEPNRVWINNAEPVTSDDLFTISEDTTLTASVLDNDVDLDGDALTVTLVTGVTHGSLSLSPDGSVTYTPDFGYFGSDEFTYEANDGRSNSNVATVTIDVLEVVNGAPVAFDQSLSVAEDGSVEITLSAADPDGPAELLTYSIVAEPAHGTVTVDPCCSGSLVTYAPNPNYVGPDSFTFIAVDPFGAVGEAAVSIEVTSALYVMAASPSPNAIDIGSAAVVIATFNSDVDAATIDGSTVTIWGHQTGFLGGAYSVSGSEVDFTPALAFKPGETVMTTLTSGVGGMSGANLDPPYTWQFTTAVDPSAGNFMESGQAIGSIDTLAIALGDFDSDGDLDAWLANNSGPDEVWLNDGAGTFLDSGQEIGVSYSLSIALGDVDNDGDLDVWTGSLDAWAETWGSHLWINDGSGSFTESDQYLGYGDAHGVEFGDVDGDGDLDAVVAYLSQPCQVWRNNGVGGFGESGESLGTRSRDVALGDLDGDGDLDAWVSYQDSYDELWPDRIWFNNGSGNFSESSQDLAFSGNRVALGDVDGDADLDAWVGLGREPGQLWLNDGRGGFTNSGQSLGSSGGSYVELGDVDGDGDLDAWAGGGTDPDFRLWLNDGDGVFTEEPPSPGDFYGGPIALGDLDGDGDLDALFLELISTQGRIWFNNAEPVTSDDLFTISEDTTLTASVLDNDVDLDGDALTVTLVTGVTHGSLSLSPDGSFTYTPAPEFFGTDSFTYQVSDGPSTSDIATVTIEIEPVNDPPMVSIQPPGDVPEGEEFTLTAQVSDSDDEVVSLRWDWGNGDTLTGTPAEMEQVVYAYCEGLHTVTLTATDESGDQGTASLVLDIWKRPILLGPLVFSENPAPAMTPVSLTTTVYGSADARGQACETVTVEFDWQDGQVDELVVTPGWGAEISAEHVYEPVEQETNYPVGVTVLGLGGQISGKTITITPESWGTDPGTDVVVEPIDPGTGEGVVRVIFEEVTEAGVTSGTATSTDQTPMPPGTNFQLMGGVYIDVHTTAQWAGSVQICLHYGGFEVDEGHLSIGHLVQNEPGFPRVWVNITDPDNPPENPNPDLVNKIICGTADSLSFFALFESIEMAAPLEPIQLGTPTNVSVQLTDPTTSDSAEWSWGDGEVTSGVYTSDGVEGTYVHSTPGVYPVGLTLLQGSSEVGSAEHRYVVVYDPDGGFVTGGGWIESPAGAYTPDPALTGRGNFGFVAKYKKGAQVPIGNTEFQFKVAHLDFKSTTYQWLVVAGAKAKFKGDGTINGEGDYGFMLSAIDGALPGGQGEDKFRIKIWDKDNGDAVVYDNELDAEDDADPTTIIGGGSIVIHKSK